MTTDPRTHAAKIWPRLVELATAKTKATYGELAPLVGMFHRNLNKPLDEIARQCQRAGLPPLTVVVVNGDTGKPGVGFLDNDDVAGAFRRVYDHDWSKEKNPFAVFAADAP